MKIVFTIPNLCYSGAPKMLAWVASQMAAKGHEVHIVAFFSDLRLQTLHPNVIFHCLGIKQSKSRLHRNTVGMAQNVLKLQKYVKKEKPDVLVSFLNSSGYVYLPFSRILNKTKLVISERADPYTYKGFLAKLRFQLMKYAHGAVFQTDGAKDFFKDSLKYPSVVIPNPVVVSDDVKELLSVPLPKFEERDNRIVTVGRLSISQKRQDVLLKAFEIVHKAHPEMQLAIYGDGVDNKKLQAMINELGLSDCAFLAGRTSTAEKSIYNARAFALSSDFEGIPNALIEALSVGVPSVSTDCSPGGAALLIQDGENGYLVPRGDHEALASRLIELIENKELSERFSQNGPVISERFSEESIADKWESFFSDICTPKK